MPTHVLVCDDDPAMLRLASHAIAKAGYDVVQAADGYSAWKALQDGAIRLAVLDWEIPRPNAIEICERLKTRQRCQPIYVIILTGRSTAEDITMALEAGASDFIKKPFVAEELVARLRIGQRTIQMQAELTQAQKLESVGQLAAGIAHEINTPTQYVGDNTRFLKEAFGQINSVLEEFDKLLRAAKDGAFDEQLVAGAEAALQQADVEYLREEIPQAIDESLDGIELVTKIVKSMKEFSHPGGEEKSLINLAEAIETTITVARNEWKYVAEIVREFDTELPPVSCLPGELNQVLLNLIVNAAHAIGDVLGDDPQEKGTITVGTRRDGEWAEIIVRDTGTGIPEDIRTRIFDPFFTTKEVGKGTGQGLAIARSVVVDKHGGTIHCETEPGKGTTFIVRLPIDGKQRTQRVRDEYEDACSIR